MLDRFDFDSDSKVLVIGASSIDVVGKLDAPLEHGTSNPARIRTSLGGTARNVAENLARLGQPVKLVSAVGRDQVGEQAVRRSREAGVDVDDISVSSRLPTGSYLGVVNRQGELDFALDDMRAISAIEPDTLDQLSDAFDEAAMVFVDANLSEDCLAKAFELCAARDIPVVADPTSRTLASKLSQHLKHLFLLTPNHREAAVYLEHDVPRDDSQAGIQAAKALVGQGVDFAIITLAEFGLAYASAEGSGHIPAIKTEILDPTGGGDALTAAVIFGLLNEIPVDEAVRLGISAASLTLRQRGSVRGDLSLELLYDHLVV